MIVLIVTSELKKDSINEFYKIASYVRNETLKEKGCIKYDFVEDINNPNISVIIEYWDNEINLENHSKSKHFIEYVPKMNSLRIKKEINKYILNNFENY